MTPRQKAYELARQRGIVISENREGNGVDIRIEAPKDCNFGSEHEILIHWYSGSDWTSVIEDIENQNIYKCNADCDGWDEEHCDWWMPEESHEEVSES